MPVFQYDQYRNPYGPSIAEALGHQGDVQANLALQQGAIAAQAARDRGQMWGNILDTVGNTAVAIPQHQLAARRQALLDQQAQQQIALGGYQLDAAQRDQQSRAAFDEVVKDPANYNADGSPNHARILEGLRQRSPAAAMAFEKQLTDAAKAGLDLTKTAAEIAASQATTREKTDKVAENERGALGDVALTGVSRLQVTPDQPLQVRDLANRLVNRLVADKTISPERANQFYLQMAKAGPDEIGSVLQSVVPAQKLLEFEKTMAELNKPLVVGKGSTVMTPPGRPGGGTVLFTAPEEPPKAGTQEDWVARARRQAVASNGGVPLTDAQLQTVDTAALQSYKESNVDPQMRDAALAQRNIAQALAQLQLNQTPTAEQAASVADDLVNHRLAPEQLASLFSTRGREGLAFKLAVSSEAKKLDPGFNWEESAANYQLVKSPNFQTTVRYMDSVQESIPRLLNNASRLGRGPITSLNQLANMAASQFSDTDLKRLKTDAVLVGDEVAKLLAGGGSGSATSDAKLKQGMDLINAADSVPAMAAGLDEINNLIGFRRKALTRGTYLEGTSAGQQTRSAPPAVVAAPALPAKGEKRTFNGETRMWDGGTWQPLKAQ